MKPLIASAMTMLLTGCGTFHTVFLDEAWTSQRLADYRSTCDSLPRVYSGVALDFCSLLGGPHKQRNKGFETYAFSDPVSVMVDMAFSGFTDTLVLPYTIYMQATEGNIPKSRLE